MLPNLEQLARMPEHQLAKKDLAELSFEFAKGLPGAEVLSCIPYAETLDEWAKLADRELKLHYPFFETNPGRFQNSKNRFRMLALVTVLQRDLRICYDPQLVGSDDFFVNSANAFLHGAISRRMGTCSNLPILVVTIGRRLGYPLKLVSAKGHLFARWDAPDEKFNIECTSVGFVEHSDDHYLAWPYATTRQEVSKFRLLESKSPKAELALLFATRGHVLLDNLNFKEAAESYAYATQMQPECQLHRSSYEATINRWRRWLRLIWGKPFPQMEVSYRVRRFPMLPFDDEVNAFYLEGLAKWIDDHGGTRPIEAAKADYRRMIADAVHESNGSNLS